MPFMSHVPTLYFHPLSSEATQSCDEHAKRLKDILDACNMQKHAISGDGNTFIPLVLKQHSPVMSMLNA